MAESATGQLLSPAKDISTHNAPGSGIGMILGPHIRRQRRTLHNIERQFLQPLLEKFYRRLSLVNPAYPKVPHLALRFHSSMGMIARELELTQLGNLAQLVEGPARLAIVRTMVEQSSLANKDAALNVINAQMLQAAQQSNQDNPADMARLISAQARQVEVEKNSEIKMLEQQIRALELKAIDEERKRETITDRAEIAVKAERSEAQNEKDRAAAALDAAKTAKEAAEAGLVQVETIKAAIEALQAPLKPNEAQVVDTSLLETMLERLEKLEQTSTPAAPVNEPIQIERDDTGAVIRIGGRAVRRGANGFIEGLE